MKKNIIIPDNKKFEEKKKKFTKDNFHIIADFDGTLTKIFVNDKKSHSSFSWIREQKYLDPEYTKQACELYHRYYPIEIDPNIPLKEKDKQMMIWWKAHLKLFVDYRLDKKIISKIINKTDINLRENGDKFIRLLKDNNIPLLIFSAGLGDVIKGYLELKDILSKNIHLISNFFKFDEKGKVISYDSKIIHTFNKNEYAVKNTPYHQIIEKRKNVLLLGDNLGDLGMSKGINHENIIKIGFLNHSEDRLLEKFKKKFDVIILNDGPMDFINDLIEKIIN
jgi:cytosolic 5'-nucleotidase 3